MRFNFFNEENFDDFDDFKVASKRPHFLTRIISGFCFC